MMKLRYIKHKTERDLHENKKNEIKKVMFLNTGPADRY